MVNGDFITEQYLFCKELPKRTIGQEIFRITNEVFTTHGIHWSNYISVCVDGASEMMGADKGFAEWVKRQNPAIQIMRCCIHREALMIKHLPHELSETVKDGIKIVNLIKPKALNSPTFSILETERDQKISHCYFTLLCVGFHEEKFSQDYLSSSAK